MKNVFHIFLFIVLTCSTQLMSQDYKPTIVKQTPEVVFMPSGFDSNDNAQVVVAGEYNSTCYKMASVDFVINHKTKTILIRNKAYYYSSSWCAMMAVPYYKAVDLGILTEGEYKIKAEKEDGGIMSAGRMQVTLSKSSDPDDYIYAPVKEIYLVDRFASVNNKIVIRGEFTNSCMKLDHVKILNNTANVIEILPISKIESGPCKDVMVPFEKVIPLEKEYSGKVLIHVRSLSGQAVNNVVDFGM